MVKHAHKSEAKKALTLKQRRAFMRLSLRERHSMLAAQAARMVTHYEQESERSERETWQRGDIGEP
jgi:hypothetical protein